MEIDPCDVLRERLRHVAWVEGVQGTVMVGGGAVKGSEKWGPDGVAELSVAIGMWEEEAAKGARGSRGERAARFARLNALGR